MWFCRVITLSRWHVVCCLLFWICGKVHESTHTTGAKGPCGSMCFRVPCHDTRSNLRGPYNGRVIHVVRLPRCGVRACLAKGKGPRVSCYTLRAFSHSRKTPVRLHSHTIGLGPCYRIIGRGNVRVYTACLLRGPLRPSLARLLRMCLSHLARSLYVCVRILEN